MNYSRKENKTMHRKNGKFIFKKGPFTRTEQNLIDDALSKVFKEEGISYGHIKKKKIFFSKKELPKNFWRKVTFFIPSRTVESVYDHVRRRLSSKNYQGKWKEDEIIKLKNLVNIYGQKWTKIGLNLNRLPGACYDKWRDALKNGNKRKKGRWTQEEKSKLIQLVTIQTGHRFVENFDAIRGIKWTEIAGKVISRSYLQSRNEWARFFIPGSGIKLTLQDSYELMQSIFFSKVKDETEIKWDKLIKSVPAHKIYNKWKALCKNFFKKSDENFLAVCFKTVVFMIKNSIYLFLIKKNRKKKLF